MMNTATEPTGSPGDTNSAPKDASTVDVRSFQWTKAKNIYEGSDSDDDEIITSGGRARANTVPLIEPIEAAISSEDCLLRQGQLCEEGESFCPWRVVKTYPYINIGQANRSKVAQEFFDYGRVYERSWDFFYLYRSYNIDAHQSPLILVPTKQLEHFLDSINRKLDTNLVVPTENNSQFKVTFEDNSTPRPRYLGQANSKTMAEGLINACPPSYFKLNDEVTAVGGPSQRSIAAFKDKIDMMARAHKGKKAATKEKQKTTRIAQQQSWNHSIKRVQRYLGIREAGREKQMGAIRTSLENSGLIWKDYDASVQAAAAKLESTTKFDLDISPPYEQERSVVFICVDVEANERNASQITEIGVATLDTKDLQNSTPGKCGINWMSAIRARHFRINEYKHVHNTDFVHGCADRFEFGTSEFIDLKDAPHIISTCFKPPFSNPSELPEENDVPKRNIVLVGHDTGADIAYLQKIGYNVYNLSNLLEIIDTASMWRVLKHEANARNLGAVLSELDITGWNLHNAGNDAVYTLQAMIRIAIKHILDKQKQEEMKEQEMRTRVAEKIKEATLPAWEKEEGWSSGGENSDGGAPITPCAPTPATTKHSRQKIDSPKQATRLLKASQSISASSWQAPSDSLLDESIQSGNPEPRIDFSQNHANLEQLMKKSILSDNMSG